MSNVIPIKAPKIQQAGQGAAFCLGCNHTWEATAPVGVTRFEFAPSPGQLVRECGCGNQLFYLTPEGHLCANCGIYQSY